MPEAPDVSEATQKLSHVVNYRRGKGGRSNDFDAKPQEHIFDNLLVLADDYDDAYQKCEKILDRCKQRNLVLKFSKTWLGNEGVEFFGYRCSFDRFELTEKRKQSILDIPFPATLDMNVFFRSKKDFVLT